MTASSRERFSSAPRSTVNVSFWQPYYCGLMSSPTVDWAAANARDEGLRERKKRQTRQLLSDTATELFLSHGFDAVRVSEIARRCGVSEKTVFNYFPTKESLVIDRWSTTA